MTLLKYFYYLLQENVSKKKHHYKLCSIHILFYSLYFSKSKTNGTNNCSKTPTRFKAQLIILIDYFIMIVNYRQL
jgi:hypothetical protein